MLYISAIIVLIAIVILFAFKPAKKVVKGMYYVAKAGEVEKLSSLKMEVNDLSSKSYVFEGEKVDIRDFEVFLVDGDSMSPVGVKNGAGLLVKRVFDKLSLKRPAVIVLEIDTERYAKEHEGKTIQPGYKVREFVDYISLSQTDDEIRESVELFDVDLKGDDFFQGLKAKLVKARVFFKQDETLILSRTYKDGCKSYSLHSPHDLYGQVQYVIPPSEIKIG